MSVAISDPNLPFLIGVTLVLTWIICAIATGYVAEKRGHPIGSATIVGFFLGVFGLLGACLLAPKDVIPCPACLAPIHQDASVCRHCGQVVEDWENQPTA